MKTRRLRQNSNEASRSLLKNLEAQNFEDRAALDKVLPYLKTIVTSLQRAGYRSESAENFTNFFQWMKSSKEWRHILDASERHHRESFPLHFYLLRTWLRYLKLNSGSIKKGDPAHSDGLVEKIYADFEKKKRSLIARKANLVLSLYFEGLTKTEISRLSGLNIAEIQRLIDKSKDTLKKSLTEKGKKNVVA